MTQAGKAAELRRLHDDADLLVLPNVWDAASATTVASVPGCAARPSRAGSPCWPSAQACDETAEDQRFRSARRTPGASNVTAKPAGVAGSAAPGRTATAAKQSPCT